MTDRPITRGPASIAPVAAREAQRARSRAIKQWHIDQAIGDHPISGFVHVSASANGQIDATAIGIEPIHAPYLVVELLKMAEEISNAFCKPVDRGNVKLFQRQS